MPDLLALKEELKTEAIRLGFSHLAVAPATPVMHYPAFLSWIEAGRNADMTYLSRPDTVAKRGDPRLLLENCQRIICLTVPYRRPEAPIGEAPEGQGRISTYARTRDYHDVIRDQLAQLEAFLQRRTEGSAVTKSYVDTGPILERSFAAQAGIGAAGKNTCLLIQGSGSYFFLAEILTDLPLPVDEPYTRDLCGSCQRCMDACPTGCIHPDRTIDAGRCISTLTIEHRGILPDEKKGLLGDWVFGCDLCQMVCPHNTQTPERPIILGNPHLPEFLDLVALFNLSEAQFKTSFGPTPLARTRRAGLLRNAAIVLGNQRSAAALPALRSALTQETAAGIADACQWAIRQIENTALPQVEKGRSE